MPLKHRRIKRQGADKTKNNIDDILKVLDETDPNNLPIFIDFNHVDISTISRDITVCKNNQHDTDDRLKSLADLVSALSQQMSTLVSSLSPALHPSSNAC